MATTDADFPLPATASWPGLCRASAAPLVCVSSPAVACSFPCLSCHPCLPCLLLFQKLRLDRQPTLSQLRSGRVTAPEPDYSHRTCKRASTPSQAMADRSSLFPL